MGPSGVGLALHCSPTRMWLARSPLAYASPKHFAMLQLYVELLKDALTEYAYAADLAGLNYDIKSDNTGLMVARARGASTHAGRLLMALVACRSM